MKNNKVKLFSSLEIILSIISLLLSASFFVLLEFGVIKLTREGGELGEGIAAAFAVLFFVFFFIGQSALCIYMIVEGAAIGKSLGRKSLSRKLLIIGGIVKLLFFAVAVFLGILFLSMRVWFCGISAFFFSAVLLFLSLFGFIMSRKTNIESVK